jgi:hypothetical protein
MAIRVPTGFGLAEDAESSNLLNLYNPTTAAGQFSAYSPQTKVRLNNHD